MAKPKSATAVMNALKKELEAENPEQVLEVVRSMKTDATIKQSAGEMGPLAATLCLGRTGPVHYSHATIGIAGLGDLLRLQVATKHFLREVLEPDIKRLEIEAEVQRRLEEPQKDNGGLEKEN